MKINIDEYYKNYKNIILKTYPKTILPSILDKIFIPSEYDFTDDEKKKIFIYNENVIDQYVNRRKEEIELYRNTPIRDRDEEYRKYCEKELRVFLKEYPEFNNILK